MKTMKYLPSTAVGVSKGCNTSILKLFSLGKIKKFYTNVIDQNWKKSKNEFTYVNWNKWNGINRT